MGKAGRLLELDALRGLAALSVLLHHNVVAAGLLEGGVERWLDGSPLQGFLSGRPPVIFFFVLSGFVLTRALRGTATAASVRGYAGWVLQRSVRLGLPSLAALVISLLLYALTYDGTWPGKAPWLEHYLWASPPEIETFALQALLLSGRVFQLDNVLWSLQHEWRLSLMFPLLALAPVFAGRRGAVLLVLAGTALTAAIGGKYGETYYLGLGVLRSLRETLYFTLPFVLGVALERARIEELPADPWQTLAGLAAVAGLARVGSDLAIFAASGIVIWLALQPGLLRSALRHPALIWLGAVSFSLYLIHEPVLAALHHTLHGLLPATAICAISLAAALPAAWLFYVGAERPVHGFARRVGRAFQGRQATAPTDAPVPNARGA